MKGKKKDERNITEQIGKTPSRQEHSKVGINIKCKTHDGMIYTILSQEHDRAEETKETTLPFADCVHSRTIQNLSEIMEIVEKGDGYWFFVEEMVAVKHTEITRIWAELGDLYYDELLGQKGN